MSVILSSVAPVIGRLILTKYLNADVGQIAEPLLRIATSRLSDASSAREITTIASNIGRRITDQIGASLRNEGFSENDLAFAEEEIQYILQRKNILEALFSSQLSVEETTNALLSDLSDQLSLSERHILHIFCFNCVSEFRKLAIDTFDYKIHRDEDILSSLKAISDNLETILAGTKKLSDIIPAVLQLSATSSTSDSYDRYDRIYLSNVSHLVDYVEILGIDDIDRSRRESRLDTAYLSLTTSSGQNEPEDFSTLLSQVIVEHSHLIIEGGAGSGKSTLLRWAASKAGELSRSSILQALHGISVGVTASGEVNFSSVKQIPTQSLSHKLLAPKLARIAFARSYEQRKTNRKDFAASISFWNKPVVPFLVRLRDLDGHLPQLDAIPTALSTQIPTPPTGWINRIIDENRALFLFDGVDEVPDGEKRYSILREIKELTILHPDISVIVTTRPHAFATREAGLDSFSVAVVDDMSLEQQGLFVRRWHSARAATASASTRAALPALLDRLLVRFENSTILSRLATNPLLCAAICALHEYDSDTLPNDERSLCAKLVEMLVYKRDLSEGRSRAIQVRNFGPAYQLQFETKKTLLARLAAEMIRGGKSVMLTTVALRLLPATLMSAGHTDLSAEEVLHALVSRSGVLRGASVGDDDKTADGTPTGELGLATSLPEAVEFIHNRFKEWLASTYFLSSGTYDELVSRAAFDGFDQACVFASAAPDQASFAQNLLQGLLQRAESCATAAERRRLHILALRSASVATVLEPALRSRIELIGKQLLPPKNMDEAKALAELGEIAVRKLSKKNNQSARISTFCIRCLSYISGESARNSLSSYLDDGRVDVINELSRHMNPLYIVNVANIVFSTNKLPYRISQESHLKRINEILRVEVIISNYVNYFGKNPFKFESSSEITHIDASSTSIKNCYFVNYYPHLVDLKLDESSIASLDGILAASTLIHLSVRETQLSDLSQVFKLTNLEVLDISWTKCTSLYGIENLHRLVELSVLGVNFEDGMIGSLPSTLTSLYMSYSTVENLLFLVHTPNVTSFSCPRVRCGDYEQLGKLEHLVYLEIPGTESDVMVAASCNKLTAIGLHRCTNETLEVLSQSKTITSIFIFDFDCTDISYFFKFESLKSIDFYDNNISKDGLEQLRTKFQVTSF